MIDEDDENYIDLVYQKQQMFIQSMKTKLKPSDFQEDWLSNDVADVTESKVQDRAKKFEKMTEVEKIMDLALLDTQQSLEHLEKQDYGLKQLIK